MNFSALLHRVQRGLSTVELVHTSHPRWPLPSAIHLPTALQISVLDSSFNPPTLAHLALANLRPSPPPTAADPAALTHDFDARLLLLSVRNVDKQLKPGDATYEQRIEMMVFLAHDLARSCAINVNVPPSQASTCPPESPGHEPNVAVAIIDEPTFVGKSAILLDFLRRRISELYQPEGVVLSAAPADPPAPKLTFLMGTDTIVRLFSSRYYADEQAMALALHRFLSPAENDSCIICARRICKGLTGQSEEQVEVQLPDLILDIAPTSRIAFADIGEKECLFSSSEVRAKISNHDEGWKTMVTPQVAHYIDQSSLYLPC